MRTYEENWEVGVLVTAEAVFGIGFSSCDRLPETAEVAEDVNEAAD